MSNFTVSQKGGRERGTRSWGRCDPAGTSSPHLRRELWAAPPWVSKAGKARPPETKRLSLFSPGHCSVL